MTLRYSENTTMKRIMNYSTLLLLSSIILLSVGCKKEDLNPSTEPETEQVEQTKKLRYEINCPECYVVYYTENQEQIAVSGESTGWFVELDVNAGFVALIAAQNQSGSATAVTATIKVDGEILKTKTTYCPISGTVLVTDTIQ